jgi:hypothetical protein
VSPPELTWSDAGHRWIAQDDYPDWDRTITVVATASPGDATLAAYAAWKARKDAIVDAVLERLWREGAVPDLASQEALRDQVDLVQVVVHPDGRIGLDFTCAWDDEQGLGALVVDGELSAIGGAELAFDPPP